MIEPNKLLAPSSRAAATMLL